jgi:hypothetical protein
MLELDEAGSLIPRRRLVKVTRAWTTRDFLRARYGALYRRVSAPCALSLGFPGKECDATL